jgi:hypothetical protein
MAHWKLQEEVGSGSPRARARTAYLDVLVPRMKGSVQNALAESPDRTDITVVVLCEIGEDGLRAVAPGKKFGQVKQDAGLKVVQVLVDLYGDRAVWTYRGSKGKVSTRPVPVNGPQWLARYTPHKVEQAAVIDRVLLDACAVGHAIGGGPDLDFFRDLRDWRGDHLVSIADGAYAELVQGLLDPKGIESGLWIAIVQALKDVLDPEMPIAPGGLELAALAGLVEAPLDLGQMRAYYKALWSQVAAVQASGDLDREYEYTEPGGRRKLLPALRQANVQVFKDEADRWGASMDALGAAVKGINLPNDVLRERLVEYNRRNLTATMGIAQLDKIDLALRVLANRALQAAGDYQPEGANDPFDFALLFGIPLPAVICTRDGGLLARVAEAQSHDGWKVMTPVEVLAWLRTGQRPVR